MVLAATPEELNMEIINTIAQEALVDMGIILHHQQLQLQPDTVQQDIMLSTIIQLPVKVKLFPDHRH